MTIDTYGGGHCIDADGTVVKEVDDFTVEITPMDEFPEPGSDTDCTLLPKDLRHEATLSFQRAGDAIIIIRGRSYSGDGSLADGGEVIQVERDVKITSE